MRTNRTKGLALALVLAATGSGCYASAKRGYNARGYVGCPARTRPVLLDSAGLGAAAALAWAAIDSEDSMAIGLGGPVIAAALLSYGGSLIAAAAADCDVTDEQAAQNEATRRCDGGDAAACYSVALVADRHALSSPDAAAHADAAFGRACELGDARACRTKGERRRLGSPDEAALFFARACELGDTTSCAAAGHPDAVGATRAGTCFFVADGVAITNHHVVDDGGTVTVLDARGRMLAATVRHASKQLDLAELSVTGAAGSATLTLGPDVGLGAHVFTIGFPFPDLLGFDPKFSEGSVSGLRGLGSDALYQISVPVQPGNSGGPLLDDQGRVVGVVVAKLRTDLSAGVDPENVNFAIKSATLARFLADIGVLPTGSAVPRDHLIDGVSSAVCEVIVQPAPPAGGQPAARSPVRRSW